MTLRAIDQPSACGGLPREEAFPKMKRELSGIDILPRPNAGDSNSCWKEHGLRFAVHWPPGGVASPCFHGVPRRAVPCRVHVRVAGVSAGRAAEVGLALARLPVHVPA